MKPSYLVLFKNKQFCTILLQRFSWRRWIEMFSVPLWFLTWSMLHPCWSVCQFSSHGAPVGNLELGAVSPRQPPSFFIYHQHIPLSLPSERLPSFFCFLSYEVLGIIFSNALPPHSKYIISSSTVAYLFMLLAFQQPNATPRKMAILMGHLLCVEMESTSSTWQLRWGTRALGLPRSSPGPTILQNRFWLCHIQLALIASGGSVCSHIEEVCKAQCWLCFSMLKTSSHQTYIGRLVSGSCAASAAFKFSIFSIELAHSVWPNNLIKLGFQHLLPWWSPWQGLMLMGWRQSRPSDKDLVIFLTK